MDSMKLHEVIEDASVVTRKIWADRILMNSLIRQPIRECVIDKCKSIYSKGWKHGEHLIVVEVDFGNLEPLGLKLLVDMDKDEIPDDIHPGRWFIIVDGGHRFCSILHLLNSGCPSVSRKVPCLLLNHKIALIDVNIFIFIFDLLDLLNPFLFFS